jgi:hypothetical protein
VYMFRGYFAEPSIPQSRVVGGLVYYKLEGIWN